MDEGMIWKTYFKHRRQELRERFPQCGRRGSEANRLTVLQFRKIMGKGLNYFYINLNNWDKPEKAMPIDAQKLPGDYYVRAIRFGFLNDSVKRYVINCYCSDWYCYNPVIEIPAFHFRMIVKYWWPGEVCDFIEHVPEYFPQWREEIRLIEQEVPKIEKLNRMKQIRSERMGLRTIEPFIESRLQGQCEISEGWLHITVPLSNARILTIKMPIQSHNHDWWEKIQAMVSAIVELFETQIAENRFNWESPTMEVLCTPKECGHKENLWWSSKWVRREDLEGLFRKKKTWRKYLPITVKIA